MNKLLLLFSFLFSCQIAFAQPENDDCDDLIDLGIAPICPMILDTFDNVGATESIIASNTNDNIPLCFNGGNVDRDVWFKFQVPADGSLVDFTVTVTGVEGPNGSMIQPQIAAYRGECLLDELQELGCATSMLGELEITLDLVGLTPGLDYFLRINDWSASATPNEGDFVLCIDELDPCYNIAEETMVTNCAGKLVDSGGEDGDYSSGENFTFTICPDQFHQCIFINIEEFATENNFDNLSFFAGDDIFAPQIFSVSGTGSDLEVQASSDCVTIQFTSDGSVTDAGFLLTWQCSGDTCTAPPIISCEEPVQVPFLPYINNELSTCFAGNTITNGPCNDFFLNGEEYIFTYNSPGDECIMIDITGSATETGVAVYNDCPNVATECLADAGGQFGQANPTIDAVFLEEPGVYYIVVGNANNCTNFNITIENTECPTMLPPSEDCEDAVSINGCGNQPSIISVSQMASNNTNFQLGCWGGPGAAMFTWFIFQAQEDGNFGFLAEDNTNIGFSDIDINVWGPYDEAELLCDATLVDEPARSTWSGLQGVTGLTDIHPVTGVPITDICEGAGGDKFVSTIPTLEGEWYVILVLDFGGTIENGEISMDFSFTSDGVLGPLPDAFTVTGDTAICPGETVQLMAEGGELIQWIADPALSCTNCPNPIATVTETTTFDVAIYGACNIDTLSVEVGLLQVDAGPDITVCMNEEIQIVAGASFQNVTYEWSGGPAGTLSCTDCPDPILTATTAGIFTYTVTVTGPSCSFSDQTIIEVLNAAAPDYDIIDNQQICVGDVLDLGGMETPGVSYTWTASDGSLMSNDANPQVNPSETTTYYLETSNGECLVPSLDSVNVQVSPIPVVTLANDTLICQGEPAALSTMEFEPGVIYSWSPPNDLENPNAPNTIATPSQTTIYTVTANRNGCETQESIEIEVTEINVQLNLPDTYGICVGEEVDLQAFPSPNGTAVTWTPNDGTLSSNTGEEVIATPETGTLYIASVEVPGCVKSDSIFIRVDSLPPNLAILPADTTVCSGSQVSLLSEIYEPALYQDITFEWTPGAGQITPDSLYNMIVQATDTIVYQRITTNVFCSDTTFATVNVVSVEDVSIDGIDPICPGESVQIVLNAPPNGDITWTPAAGLSCADCPNPVATPAATTNYSVEIDYSGCPVGASVSIEVLETPFVTFPAVSNPLCDGDDIPSLNLSPNADWDYQWSATDPDFANTTVANPSADPMVNSIYYVTITNGNCPAVIDSLVVFVEQPPVYDEPTDVVTCVGQEAQLNFGVNLPGTIEWSPAAGLSCTDCLNPVVTQAVAGDYIYSVTYSNDCGESETFMVTVSVGDGVMIDSISAAPSLTEVFEGTQIDLEVNVSNVDILLLDFLWSNNDTTDMTTVVPLISEFGTVAVYSVTATDSFGCTDTESISFDLLESAYSIPNAFTPNGQEPNEVFQVVITGENITVQSFQVWSRWGDLVHSEKGADHGWDGMQNGKPATAEVYLYKAVLGLANGEVVTEKGDVTLIR